MVLQHILAIVINSSQIEYNKYKIFASSQTFAPTDAGSARTELETEAVGQQFAAQPEHFDIGFGF